VIISEASLFEKLNCCSSLVADCAKERVLTIPFPPRPVVGPKVKKSGGYASAVESSRGQERCGPNRRYPVDLYVPLKETLCSGKVALEKKEQEQSLVVVVNTGEIRAVLEEAVYHRQMTVCGGGKQRRSAVYIDIAHIGPLSDQDIDEAKLAETSREDQWRASLWALGVDILGRDQVFGALPLVLRDGTVEWQASHGSTNFRKRWVQFDKVLHRPQAPLTGGKV
jgi:hypothetical protein